MMPMKKTFMARLTVLVIVSSVVGMQSVNVVKADQFLNCSLTVTNPNASFNYTNTMPLDLIIVYENKTSQPIIWIQTNVTYTIDQGNPINITSLPSYAHPELNGTLSIPVNQSVNINSLDDGQHTVEVNGTVTAKEDLASYGLGVQNGEHFGISRKVTFAVDTTSPNSTNLPTPTPSPEPSPFPAPAQPQEFLFSMPKEYLNYTITERDGAPWAIIDGTYPIYCPNADSVDIIPMVYPTPPNTTNITITLNGTTLAWSNFTEQYPSTLHHTALGNWAMIEAEFKPSSFFTLAIHYEHPIMLINGTWQFLYDLNIAEYLSSSSPNSTAYFKITTEMPLPNLKIYTLPNDVDRNELNYSTQTNGGQQQVTFEVTSEFNKPLPGDVLLTFSNTETVQNPTSVTLIVLPIIIIVVIFVLGVLFYFRRRK
jgi:hypothetical protein